MWKDVLPSMMSEGETDSEVSCGDVNAGNLKNCGRF